MPRTHRSIYIVLVMALIGTTSPAALARNSGVVEEVFSMAERVVGYFSNAKTIVDAADALEMIIWERAAGECSETPIPDMNDQQCAHAVSHVVNECIEVAKQKCPNFFSKDRMTCDIDCFEITKPIVKDLDDRCREGTAPPWWPCNSTAPQ